MKEFEGSIRGVGLLLRANRTCCSSSVTYDGTSIIDTWILTRECIDVRGKSVKYCEACVNYRHNTYLFIDPEDMELIKAFEGEL